ncbi:MAG: hypothetical protein A3H96_14125 [Acidobacteria bacterium RIFCSPLOWO2_02_FULL_67_36]|nr:MAG: hypothetical protein A3H96_14125 [Acidobacteria bacterium RIFCSPLOWO2_02_FULL_67_36]OFW18366.1 MAG: hypothetical protein A3G21_07635 [Acidobacteria bacterium RIFCSPLOWO2_12_FULL_66_21]
MSKTASLSIVAGLVAVLAAAPARAQQPTQSQSDKDAAHVRDLIRQATQQVQPPPAGQTGIATAGRKVDITADEAVARSLEKNPTLASQRLTPRTFDYSIAATRATYRPTLTSSFTNNSQTQLPTTTVEGGTQVNNDTQNWNGSLQQSLWWHGSSYTVSWNNSRIVTDRNNSTFNPSFGTGLTARFTQPLLQNFKTDATRTALRTGQIQQEIAELDLRASIASTEAQVRNAYWELVYAYQAVESAERSLSLSSKLVQDNRSRVEIGTMAPIDIVQAQAEEASRRQALVNAQATLRNNELALKRLIVSGTDDELWTATINPVERPAPPAVAEPIDLEAAVRNALRNRTDLETNRKSIDTANLQLRSLRNQTLPTLNLIGTYQLEGRGGTSIERDRITNEITKTIPGGYSDALRNIKGFDAPTWTVQLSFNYPIGQSAAEANLARQRLLLQQNQATIKTTELQIATDVTSAALTVRNTLESVQAAATSRELSERRLEAAQSKFDVGMAISYEVVQAQRDLADARNSELRALLNYRKALVDLQRVQITSR